MRNKTIAGYTQLFLILCSISFSPRFAAGGYGLAGGYQWQGHADELFITLFNSSYVPAEGYYDPDCAAYFSKDGINNLQYYPSNKTTAVPKFLRKSHKLGMNGMVWVPGHWVRSGFGAREYENWVRNCSVSSPNLYLWYMPDELPIVLMKPNSSNPIYDSNNPDMHDPKDRRMPWFFNKNNPDAENTVIGRTRWYARNIHNADPLRHVMISPGSGGAMTDQDRWVVTIENLSKYCDIWVKGVYPCWLQRPRTMLLYEYDQWVQCRNTARANGANVDDLYFMLLLESFKMPFSNPINYIKPEIIRFDAYASLTLGSQGLIWWNGKEWNNPEPEAQSMYKAIKSVAREINIPFGVYLAPCLLADEPEQNIKATVLSGPPEAPTYRGKKYDSMQVRLKQDDRNQYLFAANFAQVWNRELYRRANGPGGYECNDPNVKVSFVGFENQPHWAKVLVDSRSVSTPSRCISIDNGSFEDSFGGLTAKVYKILLQPNVDISINGNAPKDKTTKERDGVKTVELSFKDSVEIDSNDILVENSNGQILSNNNVGLDYDSETRTAKIKFDLNNDDNFDDSLKTNSLSDNSKWLIKMNIAGIKKILDGKAVLMDLDDHPGDGWYEICLKSSYEKEI